MRHKSPNMRKTDRPSSDVHLDPRVMPIDEQGAPGKSVTLLWSGESDNVTQRRYWRGKGLTSTLVGREVSVMDSFLGTIQADSSTRIRTLTEVGDMTIHCDQDQYENETAYTIRPAPWLLWLGVRYGLHFRLSSSSTQGWKHSLNTFRPMPDDAPIFEHCKQGDMTAVIRLLSEGLASIKDTNSRGYTPLHVSFPDELQG